MVRHTWFLVLGTGFFCGCGPSRPSLVSSDLMGNLTSRVTKPDPDSSSSPSHVRAVSGPVKEESTLPAEEPPKPATPAAPAAEVKQPEESSRPGLLSRDLIRDIAPASPAPAPKPDSPLLAALRCYCEDRPREAQEPLKAFTPAQREVLASLLPLLARLTEAGTQSGRGVVLETLERVTQSLRTQAGLAMEKLCFCRSVERFGVFDPLPAAHVFQPGGDRPGDMVQLYIELKNFLCLPSAGEYETALACTLIIRDGQNHVVFRQDRDPQFERSRSLRRDCFLRCHFYVPRIPAGDYTLCIVVKDVTGQSGMHVPANRVARGSLDFRVRQKSAVSLNAEQD
jgi:hypothetical protein